MSLSPGARLGPYEILAPLGAGGMGEVYRARDPRLGREVAIKVLPASFSRDPDRLRRFEQEARAAGVLNHPNILSIYDIGTHDGSPYVVSELLEGETLRGRVAGGAFTPRKALGHALQIAHGLAAAHEKGIVHRDLKPENIFVTRDGRVKILDFGLAKLTETSEGGSQTNLPTATPETEPGVVLGTLGYMSPEQVRGKPADARSDIFSFGAILYEMLSGQRAFHGDSAADTMSAILLKEPQELSATSREISPGLERVVRHCLEKDPERRFHSAHDLAFDLETLSEASALAPRTPATPKTWPRIALAGIAVAAVVAAAVLLLRPHPKSLDSLAVLPFVNTSGDPNLEYLSDGITESLISRLSQLPNLTVMSRNSVFHYKGRQADAQAVGRALKVQAVLTGRVAQRGENLSIGVELIDVRNNSQIWGEQYNRRLSDILALQAEMTSEIASKLQRRLSGEAEQRLAKRSTGSTEAYQLYLKGRYFWNQRGKGLQKSIGFFEQALERDPHYALAHAGIADAYNLIGYYGYLPTREALPKAKEAARKALEIDDTLAEAHTSLAYTLVFFDWDPAAGQREFLRAIDLDPSYAPARYWYSVFLTYQMNVPEAIGQAKRAIEVDPLATPPNAVLGLVLHYSHRYAEAVEQLQKTVELNPVFPFARWMLGLSLSHAARHTEAIAELKKLVELSGADVYTVMGLGVAYARSGQGKEALEILKRLEERSKTEYVRRAALARIHAALGNRDAALREIERAVEERDQWAVSIHVEPDFLELHSDPRFAELVRRVGVAPPDWQTRLK